MPDLNDLLNADIETSRKELDRDALFAGLEADLVRSTPLKTLSTPKRRGLALLVMAVVGAGMLVPQGIRNDLTSAQAAWFALCAGVLALAGTLAVTSALRPKNRHGLRVPLAAGAFLFSIGVAFSGWLPGLPQAPDPAWSFHLYCLKVTTVGTFVATMGVMLLDRDPRPAPWRLAMVAGGAGLFSFAVQSVFCPIVEGTHLAIGHGASGWLLGLGLAAIAELWRRTR